MKHFFLLTIMLCFSLTSFTQDVKIEKNITGINLGLIGPHLSHELGINNSLSTKIELSLRYSYQSPSHTLSPLLSVQPRWYYNLQNRVNKEKPITNNSGNFLSLYTIYIPKSSSLISDASFDNQIILSPMWGLRRNWGNNFSFEFMTGYGIRKVFDEYKDPAEGTFMINFSVGYNFIY